MVWNLAKAQNELGNSKDAKSNILLAYNDLLDNEDYLRDLILILRDAGDLDTAKDALKKYQQIRPDDEYMNTLFDDEN